MTSLSEIEGLSNGARFYRADMHIHSFGASHDVKDKSATPEAIVKTALNENLDVIALADHNEIKNVKTAIKAAENTSLLIVPAIELSTSSGHLLCYLPTLDDLEKFYARLQLADRGKPNSRCQNSIMECLTLVGEFKGFGVLAHVDAPSGFEIENPGNSPHKVDVLCHPALLGVELLNARSIISYSDADPDPIRKAVGKDRIGRLGLGSQQYLARVLNSDAHSLNALGRNAQGNQKVTRIKMDRPSFAALKIAFQESDSRIRIEDLIPKSIPQVLGVSFSGGFLDGQSIHFSSNLNCIIGGRGTGKSTTFEAVCCLSTQQRDADIVDSEIWPTNLNLFWKDEVGQCHSLSRPMGGETANDDDVFGPSEFVIECYGQGETARISKEAHSNPIALLSYLDRFVDVRGFLQEEKDIRDELLSIQNEIEEAAIKVEKLPAVERALAAIQQQLRALEQLRATEVIKLQRNLAEVLSHPLDKTIHHALLAGLVEGDGQLVAVDGDDIAVAELDVKHAVAD